MKNRIRELRQAHGIKQADLAKHLGVAQNTLSYWERGKYNVDNTSLQKIADYFHCSVDCVLCRAEIPRQEITEDFLGELLSDHEKELIRKYRAQPDMQESICRILGIKYPKPHWRIDRKACDLYRRRYTARCCGRGKSAFKDTYKVKVAFALPAPSGNIYIFTIYYT
jgi:transcriptional regulator with XRE-family HTH domain|nr:MAG TPA_asm: helix-turn-helix domain protein [Caudoviricetes sp.]